MQNSVISAWIWTDNDVEVAEAKSENCAEVEYVSLSTDISIFYYM